jgi:hypothetical protein
VASQNLLLPHHQIDTPQHLLLHRLLLLTPLLLLLLV